jgi:guanine nucleotide exchange factor VAV
MKKLSILIREEDMKIIFRGIKEMFEINDGLKCNMRKDVDRVRNVRISEVLLSWRERLMIYGDYCDKIKNDKDMIKDVCKRNEIVNQEVVRCQKDANNDKFKLREII